MTLKHVQTVHKGGKIYRYLRLPGQPRIRLPDLPPDDPAFLAAYAAAVQSAPKATRAPSGTIRAMAETYRRSKAFAGLSASYRAILTRHISAICEQAEDALARHLKPENIQADLAPLDPHAASKRLKAWRAICRDGMERGTLTADPSRAVVKKRLTKTEGFEAWTRAEVDAFRAAYPIGTATRAVFEVIAWTGARRSDAVKIGPGNVGADGVLSFRQSKTGKPAFVPWTCPVPAYADPAERDMMHAAIAHLAGHMTFIPAHGRGRSSNGAGNVIANAAAKIGIAKSAHGLRKYRATRMADNGATPHEIGAWTGHETLAEISHYTATADRRRAVMGTEQGQKLGNQSGPKL